MKILRFPFFLSILKAYFHAGLKVEFHNCFPAVVGQHQPSEGGTEPKQPR